MIFFIFSTARYDAPPRSVFASLSIIIGVKIKKQIRTFMKRLGFLGIACVFTPHAKEYFKDTLHLK